MNFTFADFEKISVTIVNFEQRLTCLLSLKKDLYICVIDDGEVASIWVNITWIVFSSFLSNDTRRTLRGRAYSPLVSPARTFGLMFKLTPGIISLVVWYGYKIQISNKMNTRCLISGCKSPLPSNYQMCKPGKRII